MEKATISFLLCVLLFQSGAFGQDCTKFQVLDLYTSSTDYATYEQVKDVVCSSQSSDSGSAKNFATNAGIPIPILDDVFSLKFGASGAANDWSSWRSSFCSSHYSEVYTKLSHRNLSHIFSDNAKEVVKSCLQREPVYGYFEVPADGQGFSFNFSVTGHEKLKGAAIQDPNSVSNCNTSNPFGLDPWHRYVSDLDISGEKKAFGCSWSRDKLVQLRIRLVNQGDRVFQLEPIKTIPPTPPPIWHTEDQDGRPYIAHWQYAPNCKGQYGLITIDDAHRCDIERTQIHPNGDPTGYDTWNLYMDAPQGALVYEVGCEPTGEHEIQPRGMPQGQTGLCTGLINGGVAPIRMSIKWKQLW